MPMPKLEKMSRFTRGGCVNPNPMAVAINGAVHGVAIMTAKKPVKKLPVRWVLAVV